MCRMLVNQIRARGQLGDDVRSGICEKFISGYAPTCTHTSMLIEHQTANFKKCQENQNA